MIEGASAEGAATAPIPAMPPRPARRLSTVNLLRTVATNSLAVCDEELFDRPIVSRRYLGLQQAVFVSDPAGIRHVLIENPDRYPRATVVQRLFGAELRTGTLASEGDVWARHRRVATPTIDPRAVRPDVPALIALAEAHADAIGAAAGGIVNIEGHVTQLSNVLWNHVVTGGDPGTLPMLRWLSKVPHKPRSVDLVPKPRWLSDRLARRRQNPDIPGLERQLRDMIAARTAEDYPGSRDLLWRLANGRDRQTGEALPPEEVRDEAMSLISGGAASVRTLTWIWYLLALHPGVEARMHAELDAVLAGRVPTPDDLPRLAYTRRVLDEVMRLYPPIPALLREAKVRGAIDGQPVARGAIVAILPWIVHRHRTLWADPDRFDPERFTPENSAGRPRLAFIPFGAGPHVCVGSAFAVTQILVVVAVLARRFRFRLASAAPVVPFGGISLQPRGGLPVVVEPR